MKLSAATAVSAGVAAYSAPASFAAEDEGVVGQKDPLASSVIAAIPTAAQTFSEFSFYLAPDAVHGVGLGTGTKNYVDAYTQIAQWPEMAVNFIESRLGIQPKTKSKDAVSFAW